MQGPGSNTLHDATILTSEQEAYIMKHASVPGHCVGLMTYLSGGEPFLVDDCFLCRTEKSVILVGYPLQGKYDLERFIALVEKVQKKFRPATIAMIAPQLPTRLTVACIEMEKDHYYTLKATEPVLCGPLKRNIKKARRTLTAECSERMLEPHRELIQEFIARVTPPLQSTGSCLENAAIPCLLQSCPGIKRLGSPVRPCSLLCRGAFSQAFFKLHYRLLFEKELPPGRLRPFTVRVGGAEPRP